LNVMRRIKSKLEGKSERSGSVDDVVDKKLSVPQQVSFVIKEATNIDHLCELYEGWTSWV